MSENRLKFEIRIRWSKVDHSYIAEVPELLGCMADGKTYEKALKNVQAIIKEWLETAEREKGPLKFIGVTDSEEVKKMTRTLKRADEKRNWVTIDELLKKHRYKEPKSLLEVRAWKRKVSREIEKLGLEGFRKKHHEKTEAFMTSIEKARLEKLTAKG